MTDVDWDTHDSRAETIGVNDNPYRLAMQESLRIAALSPDPSTQNGATLVWTPMDSTEAHVISDFNTFPEGVSQTDARWERPLKYRFVEHAERNVIYLAASMGLATRGAVMVCPWAACSDCARAIVQSGIAALIRLPLEPSDRWDAEIELGDSILNEAGVHIAEIKWDDLDVPVLRRNGVEWSLNAAH